DDATITQMLKDSIEHAEEDVAARKLAELRVEAGQLLENLSAALAADGDALLNDAERAQIDSAMAALQNQLGGEDPAALRLEIDALAQQTEQFAARRMDRSIKQALAGVTLDSLANKEEHSDD
ncbi:MAG: Fe-S protein assembly chaperone HscA, partial [Gammaproteobacteria bacterium]